MSPVASSDRHIDRPDPVLPGVASPYESVPREFIASTPTAHNEQRARTSTIFKDLSVLNSPFGVAWRNDATGYSYED